LFEGLMALRNFVFCILVFFISLAMLDYAHFPFSDGAEHGAAVRELANNFIHPDDPMLEGNYGGSARYVPSIFVMAVFLRLTGLDVLIVIKIFLVLFFLLFVFSAIQFSQLYFDGPKGALCLLASLLFLWGAGWTGANAYMFSAIGYTAYFPSVVSFSLSLLALAFLLRFLQTGKQFCFACCCILGGILFVNHPLTGAFFFITASFLLLEKVSSYKRCFVLIFFIVAVSFCFSLLWPYYQFFDSFSTIASGAMGQTDDYQMTWRYLHSNRLLRIGPALAAVPLILILMLKRKHLMITGSFVVFALIYVFGYFSKTSLSERFVFFVVFSLQVAFSFFWSVNHQKDTVLKKGFFIAIVCIAAGLQFYLVFGEFIAPAFSVRSDSAFIPEYSPPNKVFKDLRKYLKEDDIVMSDIYSSWSVPVYTGAKIIALWHTPPHIKDNFERNKAVKRFFNPAVSNTERKGILDKYGVTHILLNHYISGDSNKLIEQQIVRLGYPVVVQNKDFSILLVQNKP